MNLVTRYKLGKISVQRFRIQFFLWLIVFVVLVASFPVYNHLSGRPVLDAESLSLFDIVQTTAIIFLFYIINNQRQKIEATDRTLRELHQELSIRFSTGSDKKR